MHCATQQIGPHTRVRCYLDPDHEPHYGLDTEEETQAAIAHEHRMIESGRWVPRVLILEQQCEACEAWHEQDAIHGYVCEPSESIETSARNAGLIPE